MGWTVEMFSCAAMRASPVNYFIHMGAVNVLEDIGKRGQHSTFDSGEAQAVSILGMELPAIWHYANAF